VHDSDFFILLIIYVHTGRHVVLTEPEKRVYDRLAMSGAKEFRSLLSKGAGTVMSHYALVLEILLRIRQVRVL